MTSVDHTAALLQDNCPLVVTIGTTTLHVHDHLTNFRLYLQILTSTVKLSGAYCCWPKVWLINDNSTSCNGRTLSGYFIRHTYYCVCLSDAQLSPKKMSPRSLHHQQLEAVWPLSDINRDLLLTGHFLFSTWTVFTLQSAFVTVISTLTNTQNNDYITH